WRDFERAMRDDYRAILTKGDDARLLWYFHQAHGTGLSYTVVTVTAFTGAPAWHDFARRVQQGDLQGFATELDELRHEVRGKLLAFLQPAAGAGPRREVVLVQKLKDHSQLLRLLTYEEPESYPADSWMTKALTLRDQWESRLLRTAPWSPLW